ncbi:hypothetical protein XENTR_v10024932 [Xenopus tropicalis]|nr:hypothetical protein XENTR_v10024932 [Xenopus tropicalis]
MKEESAPQGHRAPWDLMGKGPKVSLERPDPPEQKGILVREEKRVPRAQPVSLALLERKGRLGKLEGKDCQVPRGELGTKEKKEIKVLWEIRGRKETQENQGYQGFLGPMESPECLAHRALKGPLERKGILAPKDNQGHNQRLCGLWAGPIGAEWKSFMVATGVRSATTTGI